MKDSTIRSLYFLEGSYKIEQSLLAWDFFLFLSWKKPSPLKSFLPFSEKNFCHNLGFFLDPFLFSFTFCIYDSSTIFRFRSWTFSVSRASHAMLPPFLNFFVLFHVLLGECVFFVRFLICWNHFVCLLKIRPRC